MKLLASEQEWLTTTNPNRLVRHALRHTPERASDRKLLLFQAAIARRVWPLLTDERSREAVAVAERFADGGATPGEVQAASQASQAAYVQLIHRLGMADPAVRAANVARFTVWRNNSKVWQDAVVLLRWLGNPREGRGLLPRAEQADAVRDVLGNPFRPASVAPEWRTATARALAGGIYDESAFDRLPILADALMDAGCADEQILGRCRSDGPHFRGCWVVDLVSARA